jgi:hemoglobin
MSGEAASQGASAPSTFERIGGAITIDRLVELFYERMDTLPQAAEIRAMHAADLGEVKRVLKRYFTEWTGGPPLYSSERGHPRLRQRHMGFPIGDRARDAWMLCMDGALAETIPDEGARAELRASMLKLADWMRNRAD